MVLEDRGAPKDVFMQLQKDAVAETRMAHNSAALYAKLLESNQLCYNYRLASILRKLNALGLELKPNHLQQPLETPFLARLRACAINHVLRAVKYEARLQIPNSYTFVGVADEGPAYVKKGLKNVYYLPQGKIFGMYLVRLLRITTLPSFQHACKILRMRNLVIFRECVSYLETLSCILEMVTHPFHCAQSRWLTNL